MLAPALLAALIVPAAEAAEAAESAASDQAAAAWTAREAERAFALQVYPLLQAKCFGCHGNDPDDLKGAVDLTTLEATLRGGESEEPAMVPGDAHGSILYQAVLWDGYEMPPKENDRLTDEQCELVRRWIEAGAPWPEADRRNELLTEDREQPLTDQGQLVATSGGLADEWTYRRYDPSEVWAFEPVTQPAVPAGEANPIDAFVRARQQSVQQSVQQSDQQSDDVQPAPPADPQSLVRRLHFDLTGLPPTPEQVRSFLKAWRADAERAYRDRVDELLASPHYGERQAQHWLDVARYADTGGMANDYERSNAWRYRDWVVRAFNDDMPYDRFVTAQLAGDELVAAEAEADRSLVLGTGFLRMGPWDTAMVPLPEAEQIYLDDVVHSVGQTFLSMPMRCCKCHDHKFDPVPTRDYYRLMAVFHGTAPAEVETGFFAAESQARFEQERQTVETMLAIASADAERLRRKREDAARAWYDSRGLPYKNWNDRKGDPDDTKPSRHEGLSVPEQGILKVREQDEWIWTRRLERTEPMIQSVVPGKLDTWTNAKKLRRPKNSPPDWTPETFILAGGALTAPLDPVGPGVLSGTGVPVAAEAERPYRIDDALGGRRLALARWITDPDNPLTARTIVNRVWQSHFGRGLVGTPNNFGVKGDKPTHPDLLDWMAADLVAHGWTLKRLHRLIVTSRTYRQSTRHPDRTRLSEIDPNNELLASFPPRRLSAEELRDAMLLASGELNPEVGGLPVRPEMNMEVALQPRMIQFSLAPAYQPSPTPRERNRRSLYAYKVRGQADPLMEVLGAPNPNDSCELRDTAAVTPQAFTLLNSDATTDRAVALALTVQGEADTVAGQLSRAFLRTLGREASERELSSLTEYVGRMAEYHSQTPAEPVHYPTSIRRSLVEELSGQPFEYDESLPVFEDYVPDTKPSDVSPQTRALADACLVLLNSNEFMYVY